MDKDQSNYRLMFLNVPEVLDTPSAVCSTIPKIASYKNDFDEGISRFNDKARQTRSLVAVRAKKDGLHKALTDRVSTLSGALQACAREQGNTDMAGAAKDTKTCVMRLNDSDVDAFVMDVAPPARESIEALADGGMTGEHRNEWLTTLDAFNEWPPKPRRMIKKYGRMIIF